MTSEIPKHHIRQSICATRPPYREGRQGKAVKVYTVNNESKYILIQGVPSVGALQELSRLCSSFGMVEQFSALDDYPCEDKYTEVYLVKYKKIQSARYAKRKLDDHSFFGGSLHVCYAPEYETVAEAREKLQDRRRVVAAKIKQHASETTSARHQLAHTLDCPSISYPNTAGDFISDHSKPPSLQHSQQHQPATPSQTLVSLPPPPPPAAPIPTVGNSTLTASVAVESFTINTQNESDLPTFDLPLPPKVEHFLGQTDKRPKHVHEFARVPSAHATLPVEYDARLSPNTKNLLPRQVAVSRNTSSSNTLKHKEHVDAPDIQDNLHSSSTNSKVVVKNYKPARPVTKFVPRQAIRNKHGEPESTVTMKKKDSLDQEIRKNAFQLGEQQGPAIVPNRKRELQTAAQQSVNETISEIRSKISKVITEGIQRQL